MTSPLAIATFAFMVDVPDDPDDPPEAEDLDLLNAAFFLNLFFLLLAFMGFVSSVFTEVTTFFCLLPLSCVVGQAHPRLPQYLKDARRFVF